MHSYQFISLCEESFRFLDEFGFQKTSAVSNVLLWEVYFANTTTQVVVVYDLRGHQVFVRLQPTPETSGHAEDFNYWYLSFCLQAILELHAPELMVDNARDRGTSGALTDDEIAESIAREAMILYKYAAEVLSGDFSIYKELKELFDGRRLEE